MTLAAATDRVTYFWQRAVRIDVKSVWATAAMAARQHRRRTLPVFIDMLWQAGFHDVAFSDYFECDFAMLNAAERRTFVTSPYQHHVAYTLDQESQRATFHDKLRFNERFDRFLKREWLDLTKAGPAELEAFAGRHPVLIGKVPFSSAGKGVFRYSAADVTDWAAFHAELVAGGQLLVEASIPQHPVLAAYCPGTVNTIRVVAYFDGTKVSRLIVTQKFGRGAVSDQPISGGFYTVLDERGHSVGPGHSGFHADFFETHPESGRSIRDYHAPCWTRSSPSSTRSRASCRRSRSSDGTSR